MGMDNKEITKAIAMIEKLHTSYGEQAESRIISYLRKLSPLIVREFVFNAFTLDGYDFHRTTMATRNIGVDGAIFNTFGQMTLLQIKKYKRRINIKDIQAFYNTIVDMGAIGGYLIHTGEPPKDLKHNFPIVIIVSGKRLVRLINKGIDLSEPYLSVSQYDLGIKS